MYTFFNNIVNNSLSLIFLISSWSLSDRNGSITTRRNFSKKFKGGSTPLLTDASHDSPFHLSSSCSSSLRKFPRENAARIWRLLGWQGTNRYRFPDADAYSCICKIYTPPQLHSVQIDFAVSRFKLQTLLNVASFD